MPEVSNVGVQRYSVSTPFGDYEFPTFQPSPVAISAGTDSLHYSYVDAPSPALRAEITDQTRIADYIGASPASGGQSTWSMLWEIINMLQDKFAERTKELHDHAAQLNDKSQPGE